MAGTESETILGTEEQEFEGEGEDEGRAGHRLPLARVKKIMKSDPDLQLASQDAVFLIAKATVRLHFTLSCIYSLLTSTNLYPSCNLIIL